MLEERGTIRDFAAEGFTPRDHLELGQLLGAIDVERGAKVSGSRFYFLTGQGAELELALLNLAISTATANGLTLMIPPSLVKPSAMEGTGFLGQAAQDVYHLADDDLYLVGTAEVPLAAYHSEEILPPDSLPRRYVGYSPSFRREAGSHGKDTRGIFRVHWFDKVEMFVFCAPETAEAEHQQLLDWEKQFIDALELPYRVIDVAAGDLGLSAARKYDCEAWLPTQERYREITSTSNCTEYQARRLNIRARYDTGVAPVATLNGTLCAMTADDRHAAGEPPAGGRDRSGCRPRCSPFSADARSCRRCERGSEQRVATPGRRPRCGRHRSRPRRVAAGRGPRRGTGGGRRRGPGGAVHRSLLAQHPARGRAARTGDRPVGLLQRGGDRRLPARADRQGDHLRSAGR